MSHVFQFYLPCLGNAVKPIILVILLSEIIAAVWPELGKSLKLNILQKYVHRKISFPPTIWNTLKFFKNKNIWGDYFEFRMDKLQIF